MLVGMPVEYARFGKEGDSLVLEPEALGKVADKIIFYGQVLENVTESRQRTRSRSHHVHAATLGRKILDLLRYSVRSRARKVLRTEIHVNPTARFSARACHVEARASREARCKFAELPPDSGRVCHAGIRTGYFGIHGLVGAIKLGRGLGKCRKPLKNK